MLNIEKLIKTQLHHTKQQTHVQSRAIKFKMIIETSSSP